jgi:hypothetical protein
MIGTKFGKLTVVSNVRGKLFNCICECGNSVELYTSNLLSGNNKSCGCLMNEVMIERNTTHGLSKHPAYSNWKDAKKRCFNKNNKSYKNYGERGISMHEDFVNSFELFLGEIGEKPDQINAWTVGRIDNNGWYTYSNIRWELLETQARNHSKQRNNTSGITGVRFNTQIVSGNTYTSWVASWNEGGKKRTKNFSCEKFGVDAAKEMAISFRDKKIQELKDSGIDYAETHGLDKEIDKQWLKKNE